MKKISIFVIIVILVVGIFVFINNGNNDNMDDTVIGKNYTHIYSETIVNDETDLEKTIEIYTFDENDNCISVRVQYQFSNIETAKEQYERWKSVDVDLNVTRQEDNEKIITINKSSISQNKSKKSVIEDLEQYKEASPENVYTWYVF